MRVSDVARALRLSRPAASQYLRALEATGLVEASRVRRSVVYEISRNGEAGVRELSRALTLGLGRGKGIETVFKLTTAFANPGRIEVFHALQKRPKSVAELNSSMAWTAQTLLRHLRKLESRGFVRSAGEKFQAVVPDGPLARCLAAAAAKGL